MVTLNMRQAQLAGFDKVMRGDRVVVTLLGQALTACGCWTAEGEIGVNFTQAVPMKLLRYVGVIEHSSPSAPSAGPGNGRHSAAGLHELR
jgi:hypothetical protein